MFDEIIVRCVAFESKHWFHWWKRYGKSRGGYALNQGVLSSSFEIKGDIISRF